MLELENKSKGVELATILRCLGPLVQRIFSTLLEEKDDLKAARVALQGHFRSRQQQAEEPIDVYVTTLCELIKTCEFGEMEGEMLCNQIVKNFHCRHLKERLLQHIDLDLSKTVKNCKK